MKYFLGAAIAIVAIRELTHHFGISQSASGAIVLLACVGAIGYYTIK